MHERETFKRRASILENCSTSPRLLPVLVIDESYLGTQIRSHLIVRETRLQRQDPYTSRVLVLPTGVKGKVKRMPPCIPAMLDQLIIPRCKAKVSDPHS